MTETAKWVAAVYVARITVTVEHPNGDIETVVVDRLPQPRPQRTEAADAARYRWLRKQHWSDGVMAVAVNPKEAVKLGHYCPSLELLDEAIDEARR